MDDESIRQGETWEHTITDDDLTATTAERTAKNADGDIVADLGDTASYSTIDGVRTATLTSTDTVQPLGDYTFMFTVTYADGSVAKFPEPDASCDGEDENCGLPVLTICGATDEVETS